MDYKEKYYKYKQKYFKLKSQIGGNDYQIERIINRIEIRNKLCLIFIMEILFVIFELLYFKFILKVVEIKLDVDDNILRYIYLLIFYINDSFPQELIDLKKQFLIPLVPNIEENRDNYQVFYDYINLQIKRKKITLQEQNLTIKYYDSLNLKFKEYFNNLGFVLSEHMTSYDIKKDLDIDEFGMQVKTNPTYKYTSLWEEYLGYSNPAILRSLFENREKYLDFGIADLLLIKLNKGYIGMVFYDGNRIQHILKSRIYGRISKILPLEKKISIGNAFIESIRKENTDTDNSIKKKIKVNPVFGNEAWKQKLFVENEDLFELV